MSDYLPCKHRQKLLQFTREGEKKTVQRCAAPEAASFGLEVLPTDCADCPLRSAVSKPTPAPVRKPKRRAIAPEDRKSQPDQADTRAWPFCGARHTMQIPACCGKVKTIRRCKCEGAPTNGRQVLSATCKACEFRQKKNPA